MGVAPNPAPTNPRPSGSTGTSHTTLTLGSSAMDTKVTSTESLHVGSRAPILLQTARLHLHNPTEPQVKPALARAVLDCGSQRTYLTRTMREKLQLPTRGLETLRVKTFGAAGGQEVTCEVVRLYVRELTGNYIPVSALMVPFICDPLSSHPISHASKKYEHLAGLELADDDTGQANRLEVEMFVGSDVYWNLVTGVIRRGKDGPLALETKVGWVLSGPIETEDTTVSLVATHAMRTDSYPVQQTLDDQLKRFWDLESLGIVGDEKSVYDQFIQRIKFDGERYEVSLPWKVNHPALPNNKELCQKRLNGLLKRLRTNPALLEEYDSVIRDQLRRGIVEAVSSGGGNQDGNSD